MATKPGLLLFDDPTTGLDPVIATTVDDEIVKLRDLEHVTSIIVTHQIRDAFYIAMHEATKTNGRIEILETAAERARRTAERPGGWPTKCGPDLSQPAIVRSEVVAPPVNAVSFVHNKEVGSHTH